MAYEIDSEELVKILDLSDVERFDYLISQALQHEEIWSLKGNAGWATVQSEGRTCIPFWPHRKCAALFAKSEWFSYKPQVITTKQFVERWVSGLEQKNTFVAVFPNVKMQGIVVEANRVLLAMREKLEDK